MSRAFIGPPSYNFGGPGFGASFGSGFGEGLRFTHPSLKATRLQHEADALIPSEAEVAQRAEEQPAEDIPFWVKAFRTPDRLLGGQMVKAALAGDVEDTLRNNPLFQLIDLLSMGATNLTGDYRYFADVRKAWGHTEVDEGIGNAVLNLVGDILTDPSSFWIPYAKLGMKGTVVGRTSQAGKGLEKARKATLARQALDANPATSIAMRKLRSGHGMDDAVRANDEALLSAGVIDKLEPNGQTFEVIQQTMKDHGVDAIEDFWAGAVVKKAHDKTMYTEAARLSDEVLKSGTRSLFTFGLLGTGRQVALEGPILNNLNIGLAKSLSTIAQAFKTSEIGGKIARTFNPKAFGVNDVYDKQGNLIVDAASVERDLHLAREGGEEARRRLTILGLQMLHRSAKLNGVDLIGNEAAQRLVVILTELGLSQYDEVSSFQRIIGTSLEYGQAQGRLRQMLRRGDEGFIKLRDAALAGDEKALDEFLEKYPNVSLLEDSDIDDIAGGRLAQLMGDRPLRPGVDYRRDYVQGEEYMLDRRLYNQVTDKPFAVTVKTPGYSRPGLEAIDLSTEVPSKGLIRVPDGGITATAPDGTEVILTPAFRMMDSDRLTSTTVAEVLTGLKKKDVGGSEEAWKLRTEFLKALKEGKSRVVKGEELRTLAADMGLSETWVDDFFIPRLAKGNRRLDGVIVRDGAGKPRIRFFNKKKFDLDIAESRRLDLDDLEVAANIKRVSEGVDAEVIPGSSRTLSTGDQATAGMEQRALIEEEVMSGRTFHENLAKEKQSLLKQIEMSENGEEMLEGIRKWALSYQQMMRDIGIREETAGLLNMMVTPYFSRQINPETANLINEHIAANIAQAFGKAGASFAESFLKHRKFTDLDTFAINSLAYNLGIKFTGERALKTLKNPEKSHELIAVVLEKLMGNKLKKKLFKAAKESGDPGAVEVIDLINMNPYTSWMRRVAGHGRVMGKLETLRHIVDEDSQLLYGFIDDPLEFVAKKPDLEAQGLVGVLVSSDTGAPIIKDPGRVTHDLILQALNLNRSASIEIFKDVTLKSIDEVRRSGKMGYNEIMERLRLARDSIKVSDPMTWQVKSDDFEVVKHLKDLLRQKHDIEMAVRNMPKGQIPDELHDLLSQIDRQISQARNGLQGALDDIDEIESGLTSSLRYRQERITKLTNIFRENAKDFPDMVEFMRVLKGEMDTISKRTSTRVSENLNDAMYVLEQEAEVAAKLADDIKKMDPTSPEYKRLRRELGSRKSRIEKTKSRIKDNLDEMRQEKKAIDAGEKQARKGMHSDLRKLREEWKANSQNMHDLMDVFRMQKERGFLAWDELVQRFGQEKATELLKKFNPKGTRVALMHREVFSAAFGQNGLWHRMNDRAAWTMMPNVLDRFTQWWKIKTTVGGPFLQSRARDVVSNFFMLMMGGTNPLHLAGAMSEGGKVSSKFRRFLKGEMAIEDLAGSTIKLRNGEEVTYQELFEAMSRGGLINSSYVQDEMLLLAGESVSMSPASKGKGVLDAARRELISYATPLDPQRALEAPIARAMMGIGDAGDAWTKTAGVIAELRAGRNLDDAVRHTRKWSYGAGDYLSTGEQNLRRMIPFYTWSRFALSRTADVIMQKPSFANWIEKVNNNAFRAHGLEYDESIHIYPSWLKDNLGIPIGKDDAGNVTAYMFGSYLPVGDLLRFAGALESIGGDSAALNYIMQQGNPAIKTAVELISNKSFWRDAPISQFEGDTEELFGVSVSNQTAHVFKQMRILNEIDRLNIINFKDVERTLGQLTGDTPIMQAVNREVEGYQQESASSRFAAGGFGVLPRAYEVDFEEQAARQYLGKRAEAGRLKGLLRKRYEQRDVPDRAGDIEGIKESLLETLARLKRLEEQGNIAERQARGRNRR